MVFRIWFCAKLAALVLVVGKFVGGLRADAVARPTPTAVNRSRNQLYNLVLPPASLNLLGGYDWVRGLSLVQSG